jgi:hypothetical protein
MMLVQEYISSENEEGQSYRHKVLLDDLLNHKAPNAVYAIFTISSHNRFASPYDARLLTS